MLLTILTVMLNVSLIILKVIGIALLAVIFLLLFILAVVLFAPIRYRIEANNKPGVNDGVSVNIGVKASWLFRLLRIKYTKNNNSNIFSVKLLWFELSGNTKTKKEKKTKSKKSTTVNSVQEPKEETIKLTNGKEKPINETKTETTDEPKDIGFFQRLKAIKEKIGDFINYPDFDIIKERTIKLIIDLLKAMKPRVFNISGVFGFDDPSLTGKVLGFICAFSDIIGLETALTGDFEKKALRINALVADKLTFFTIVKPAVIYLIKKPIRPIVLKYLFRKD